MSATRRTELGRFLRERRGRLQPDEVGLPEGSRRRTPGLRREEVAQLAGVGLTWYTWLEQGRDINASEQVLLAIARVLRLNDDERDHVLSLAGMRESGERSATTIVPALLDTVAQLMPYPACVQNGRFDLLAYNRTYRFLIEDVDGHPPADRNCMVLHFVSPDWEAYYRDHREVAVSMVARLRAQIVDHLDDPSWTRLVARLRDASPLFDELWSRQEVSRTDMEIKEFDNPRVGLMRFRVASLWWEGGRDVRILVMTPADDDSARRVRELDALVGDEDVLSING